MLKGTRSKRMNQKRQTRRLRSGAQKQRGGNPDEKNLERKQYKYWIDILFFGARDTTFGIPDMYRMKVMRGMARFALEQLTSDDPEDKEIIYEAFEKWSSERYKSKNNNSDNEENNNSDNEENNQHGG